MKWYCGGKLNIDFRNGFYQIHFGGVSVKTTHRHPHTHIHRYTQEQQQRQKQQEHEASDRKKREKKIQFGCYNIITIYCNPE